MSKQFLGLITRCKDEYFIGEFCEHYLHEGVDQIIIIDDDSVDKSIYDQLEDFGPAVTVLYEKNIITEKTASRIFKKFRHDFEWMIYLDVDEFISAPKSSNTTIRRALKTIFNDVDCVKVPWVMMACNGLKTSPESILTALTYRWDHDKKHPNPIAKFRCRYDQIEVKCIFRTDAFSDILDHRPKGPDIAKPRIVDSIHKANQPLNPYFYGLREADIQSGHLLCYHYRITSVANSAHKIATSYFYQDLDLSLDDLMSSDHAEVIDTTLQAKTIARRKLSA